MLGRYILIRVVEVEMVLARNGDDPSRVCRIQGHESHRAIGKQVFGETQERLGFPQPEQDHADGVKREVRNGQPIRRNFVE